MIFRFPQGKSHLHSPEETAEDISHYLNVYKIKFKQEGTILTSCTIPLKTISKPLHIP